MDNIHRLARRFSRSSSSDSSLGLDDNNSHHLHDVGSPDASARNPHNLRVDTSVLRDYKSKMNTFDTSTFYEKQPQQDDRRATTPTALTGAAAAKGMGAAKSASMPITHEKADDNNEANVRRRRSNSECLFLAKNRGVRDLPGPCKEYISSVKQILARSEDPSSHREATIERRRTMSLRNSPVFKEAMLR
ncbi:TPA: hypothetical protein N0F65_010528 [Lagenidium giganteum]|uniref:Uncharacterized protein n=1 Tax=Lagenidium giganteum TaxID=4803 RepID=A0AAV2ZBX5_9STRA|nr:TPA: hypothetical protein N0F65_010528 [Lagenidium giganteum]